MKGFKELVNKLKGIKNIEIILAVAIGIIILVIYFFPSENKNKNQQTESGITINTSSELTDEQKLKNVLSEIKGAGRIEVMITYESSPELCLHSAPTLRRPPMCSRDRTAQPSHRLFPRIRIPSPSAKTEKAKRLYWWKKSRR